MFRREGGVDEERGVDLTETLRHKPYKAMVAHGQSQRGYTLKDTLYHHFQNDHHAVVKKTRN